MKFTISQTFIQKTLQNTQMLHDYQQARYLTLDSGDYGGVLDFQQFLLLAKEILSFLLKTFKSHPGVNVINSNCRHLKCLFKVA